MAEEELLEPLVIIEDGDLVESITEIRAPSGADVTVQSCSEEFAIKKEEEHTEEENSQQGIASERNLEEQSLEKQQINRDEDKPEITESTNDGLKGNDSKSEGQPDEVLKEKTEKLCSTEDEKATKNDPEADTNKLNSSELQPEAGPDHKEDLKKVGICPSYPEITCVVNQLTLTLCHQPLQEKNSLVVEELQVPLYFRACGST